jgi:hypothetical protein
VAPKFKKIKSNKHKKTAGVAGGFWKIGTFFSGTFRTLYRRGALENQK